MTTTHVMVILGTRPEVIKLAPVIREFGTRDGVRASICVTGQHRQMLHQMLGVFGIEPDFDLDVMIDDQTLIDLSSSLPRGLDRILSSERPDFVLVQGDTTTALFAALVAFYHGIPVGHVEAGLRTPDKYYPFPEEMNRRLISQLSDVHLAPTERARQNLIREKIDPESIAVTGNPVIDSLLEMVERGTPIGLDIDPDRNRIIVVTAHRRENIGGPLTEICLAVREIVADYPDVEVVFPVHLNPAVQKTVRGELGGVDRIHLTEPFDYPRFASLLSCAYLILSDSGGIQEEAPSLGKPVLVLRDESERPEAVEAGTARVVGTKRQGIVDAARTLLTDRSAYQQMARVANPFGDGKASPRIVDRCLCYLESCGRQGFRGSG